jgi:hypothetical protein
VLNGRLATFERELQPMILTDACGALWFNADRADNRSRSMTFGKFHGIAAYAVRGSHAKLLWPPPGRISSSPARVAQ